MPSKKSKRDTGDRSKKIRKAGAGRARRKKVSGPEIAIHFKSVCDEDEQLENLRRLVGEKSIKSMQQVFPGERDLELATLVVVTLGKSARIDDALKALNADDEIEIAHAAVKREPQ